MESVGRYLDTGTAAAYVGLSPGTLRRMRVDGSGPRHAKLGRRVLYDVHRLDEWMEAHGRRFTGQAGVVRLPDAGPDDAGPGDAGTVAARIAGRYLDTGAAAAYVGLSASKLNRMRAEGGGPRYAKRGRRVLYDVHGLDEWIAAHERRFTGGRDEA